MTKSTAAQTTATKRNDVPPVWRLKNSHELELMTLEDNSYVVRLQWSTKLTMYFNVPEGYTEEQAVALVEQMYRVGHVRHDRWQKEYPEASNEIIF